MMCPYYIGYWYQNKWNLASACTSWLVVGMLE